MLLLRNVPVASLSLTVAAGRRGRWSTIRRGGDAASRGTIRFAGVYGHSWFVDPESRLTVVALTNTTFEGMSGRFTTELRDAAYRR